MKTFMALICLINTSHILAQTSGGQDYGYLKKEDQQYFKNDSMEGQNRLERIDANVKEINKLHGEISSMKSDIAELKKEIEILKNKK